MDSNDIMNIIFLIFVGICIGMLLVLGLCQLPDAQYVDKDKLLMKSPITHATCYVQYSAVRRFPR